VIRELRTELARRSLAVCEQPEAAPEIAPLRVVTLLAGDGQRVSIVASNLEKEGGFSGRTILVSAIPEDARPLAIAQAVDESLRSEADEPDHYPRSKAPAPVSKRPALETPRPSWFVAAALAPTLQIAPSGSGRTQTVVAPRSGAPASAARSAWQSLAPPTYAWAMSGFASSGFRPTQR
jgi:hypothetical protein